MYIHKNISNYSKNCNVHNIHTRNKNKFIYLKLVYESVFFFIFGKCVSVYYMIQGNVQKVAVAKLKKIVKFVVMVIYYTLDDFIDDCTPWK